jgi:hypothetical protein
MNTLGIDAFGNYLKTLGFLFSSLITLLKVKISHFKKLYFWRNYIAKYFYPCLNRFRLDEYLRINGGFLDGLPFTTPLL